MKVLLKVFGSATSKKDVDDQLGTIKINEKTFAEAVGQAVKDAASIRIYDKKDGENSESLTTSEGAISVLDKYLKKLPEKDRSELITHILKNYVSYGRGQNN